MIIYRAIDRDMLQSRLTYDAESGDFFRKTSWGSFRAGDKAGYLDKDGYIAIRVNFTRFLAHRLAWVYMTSENPPEQIDHINGIRHDNRFCNLRLASIAQNRQNIPPLRKRGLVGTTYCHQYHQWRARITIDRVIFELGYFDTAELAHEAYARAKREWHEFQPVLRAA